MGNLGQRIKATLLRRDSRRASRSPSKGSLGRGYTSSASTHTHPGYDASDERSDRGSVGHEQAAGAGKNSLGGSHTKNKNSHKNDTTADGDASGRGDGRRKSSPRGDELQTGGTDGAGATRATAAPARPGHGAAPVARDAVSGAAPGAGAAPARGKTSAPTAPPAPQDTPQLLGPSGLAPAPNASATAGPGNDQRRLPSHSRADSSMMPTTAATTTTTNNTNTANTANITTTPPTPSPGITTDNTTDNNTAALPSIHEQPATPPSSLPARPEPEAASLNPQPSIAATSTSTSTITIQRGHDNDNGNDNSNDPHGPPLLTPLTASPLKPSLPPSSAARPAAPLRRQSLLPAHQTNIVRDLLDGPVHDLELDGADPYHQYPLPAMVSRKIWVKRPLASATLITVNEEDLVDDVREQILRKYANSLGRQYDAPDLTLRICNWEQQTSRPLQPDEPIAKVIDACYTNGQSVDDALLIDIPSRRTPKASPNPRFYADDRPHESGTDYFPPYQPQVYPHHALPANAAGGQQLLNFPASMSIVGGNPLPPMPSPGSSRRLALQNRPNMQRMHTSSPISTTANSHTSQAGVVTIGTQRYPKPGRSRTHSGASSDQSNHQPAAPPIPTPPPIERIATPPPPRVASPRPSVRTKKKRLIETPTLPSGFLDTAVPPINILIVEDNMINLRLLEAFVKRLKVRWQTAVNGKEAVEKWRAGGFHLVLMDIQLPLMNGLEATHEIRRIEKANSIGVFSSSASSPPDEVLPEPAEEDRLTNTEMFKSPVIIVALTASSLQSDRTAALAAGCNDFLTKPVNFDWLQRKVKEWGCMQALIDFDGWRKWKDFSQKTEAEEAAKKAAAANKGKPVKKSRIAMPAAA